MFIDIEKHLAALEQQNLIGAWHVGRVERSRLRRQLAWLQVPVYSNRQGAKSAKFKGYESRA
jgi:hypothetical protein